MKSRCGRAETPLQALGDKFPCLSAAADPRQALGWWTHRPDLCLRLPLAASPMRPFPFRTGTLVQDAPETFTLTTSAKMLFPNKVTCTGSGGCVSWGAPYGTASGTGCKQGWPASPSRSCLPETGGQAEQGGSGLESGGGIRDQQGVNLRFGASQMGSGQKETPKDTGVSGVGPGKVHPAPLRTQSCPHQWFVCRAGAPWWRQGSPKSPKLDYPSS